MTIKEILKGGRKGELRGKPTDTIYGVGKRRFRIVRMEKDMQFMMITIALTQKTVTLVQ